MAITTLSSRLTGDQDSIVDLLGLPPGVENAELEIPRPRDLARPADLRPAGG